MAPGTPFASMLRSKHFCDCLLPLRCLALFSVLLYLCSYVETICAACDVDVSSVVRPGVEQSIPPAQACLPAKQYTANGCRNDLLVPHFIK